MRSSSFILKSNKGQVPNKVNRLLATAWARFDHTSIVGSNPVTQWQDKLQTAARDLDVVAGTGANLIALESGVALLTGTAGDYLSTPASAANKITGDIDFRFRIAPVDWSPAGIFAVGGRLEIAATQRSYYVEILTDGKIQFSTSPDGTAGAVVLGASTVGTGFANGTTHWGRITLDVDDGGGNRVYEFFTSDEDIADSADVTWTQLGTTVTTAGTTSIFAGTSIFEIGSLIAGTNELMTGKFCRFQVYNGINGTLAVDCDPSQASVNTATFTSGGVVWTANGDAFVNATSFTGIYSRGSVGLETTAGQSITGTAITVYAVFKPLLAAPGADQFIFDARSNAAASVSLRSDESNSDKYTLNQGSDIALTQAYDNDLQVYTAQILGTASTKLTADAGSVTGDAGSENWDFGSIFMALGAGSTTPGLFLELQIYDVAHTAGEIALMRNHLGVKYA